MALAYFAYDIHMARKVIDRLRLSPRLLGPARLDDYRLVFTRQTEGRRTAADLVPAAGFCVYGALYELAGADLDQLDAQPGYARTRRKASVKVVCRDADPHLCETVLTHVGTNPSRVEAKPSSEYLETIIEGARDCRLPTPYVELLESLRTEPEDGFRKGHLVKPTLYRSTARGRGIARLSSQCVKELRLRKWASATHGDRTLVVRVLTFDGLDDSTCELDQTLREALGIAGMECYGHCVTFRAYKGSRVPSPMWVDVRTLMLPVEKPFLADSEKNICILHEHNIRLLGLNDGDYVHVLAGVVEGGHVVVRRLILRVFAGATDPYPRQEPTEQYPSIGEVYLDRDGRLRLGIDGRTGYPVLIVPNVPRLLFGRLLFYGVTLFLAADALLRLLESISGWNERVRGVVALLLAIGATIGICIMDVRSRAQY